MALQTKTIRHGKHTLAGGLAWATVDPLGVGKHKEFSAWKAEGATHGVGYKCEDVELFCKTDIGHAGHLSIGRMAAVHPNLKGKTALLLIEVGGGGNDEQEPSIIAVGLNRGFVEVDRIVAGYEVAALRNAFGSKLERVLEIFGDGPNVGNIDFPLSLDDLLAGSKPGASKIDKLSSGQIEKWLIVGSILAVAAIAAVMVWQSFERQRAAQEALALEAQRTPQVLYEQAIAEYLVKPYVPLAQAIAVLRENLKDFPTIRAGWALEKMSCSAEQCVAQWVRLAPEGGTIEDFRVNTPLDWGPVTAMSQTEVIHTVPIKLPTATWSHADWPVYKDWSDRNVAQWQRLAPLEWKAELGRPELQAVPAEFQTVAGSGDLSAMPNAIRAATLEVGNMPMWFVQDDEDNPLNPSLLTQHVALVGEIVIVNEPKNIHFSAKGLLHVQN